MTLLHRDRGVSLSVLVMSLVGGFLLAAGLVVDGGQQVTAARRAEAAASGAARAAADAGARARVAGRPDPGAAVRAGAAYLAATPDVRGEVALAGGRVRVTTSSSAPTVFLGLIGLDRVQASAHAEADLFATGQQPR